MEAAVPGVGPRHTLLLLEATDQGHEQEKLKKMLNYHRATYTMLESVGVFRCTYVTVDALAKFYVT